MNNSLKILIIDDDPKSVKLLEDSLLLEGYEVEKAYDGREAVKKLDSLKPHLITLDMNMPGMDGLDFLKEISGDDGRPLYPVFVLSGRSNLEQIFKELHVDGFMIKPCEVLRFVKEVGIILQKRYGAGGGKGFQENREFKQVLIVDGNENAREQLAVAFISAGYSVSVEGGGIKAIERVFFNEPNLLLVNYALPDISGEDVVQKLKYMPKTSGVPAVLFGLEPLAEDVYGRLCGKFGTDELMKTADPYLILKKAEQIFSTVKR